MGAIYFTDSCYDMPQGYAEAHQLSIIHMPFHFGDGVEHTQQTMPIADFYARLRTGDMSTTSQINADTFESAFEKVLAAGDDVVYIGFSSGLSGTYQSAVIAQKALRVKYPQREVYAIDTLCASAGQGLLVHLALKMRDRGASAGEVARWVEENKMRVCHWVMADDLKHLHRGGRVSATAAFAGTMLGIKPIIHVDDEGKLIAVAKVRGQKKALASLVDHMAETAIDPEQQEIFISHSDSPGDAEYVAQLVRERWNVRDVQISYIGPVIGSHTGSGTIALFFLGGER